MVQRKSMSVETTMASKHTSPSPLLLTRTLCTADIFCGTYGTCAVKTRIRMTTSEVQLNTQNRQQKNIQGQKKRVIKVRNNLLKHPSMQSRSQSTCMWRVWGPLHPHLQCQILTATMSEEYASNYSICIRKTEDVFEMLARLLKPKQWLANARYRLALTPCHR